ncbi:MAG: hypothetical protein EOP82_02780 [Variovorax sp.]|nr:MAG: hypothetical protein EOP82_02780 [Variovorax sp.]
MVQDPRLGDSVASWLHPGLAARLERAGMPTLFALVDELPQGDVEGTNARRSGHGPGWPCRSHRTSSAEGGTPH